MPNKEKTTFVNGNAFEAVFGNQDLMTKISEYKYGKSQVVTITENWASLFNSFEADRLGQSEQDEQDDCDGRRDKADEPRWRFVQLHLRTRLVSLQDQKKVLTAGKIAFESKTECIGGGQMPRCVLVDANASIGGICSTSSVCLAECFHPESQTLVVIGRYFFPPYAPFPSVLLNGRKFVHEILRYVLRPDYNGAGFTHMAIPFDGPFDRRFFEGRDRPFDLAIAGNGDNVYMAHRDGIRWLHFNVNGVQFVKECRPHLTSESGHFLYYKKLVVRDRLLAAVRGIDGDLYIDIFQLIEQDEGKLEPEFVLTHKPMLFPEENDQSHQTFQPFALRLVPNVLSKTSPCNVQGYTVVLASQYNIKVESGQRYRYCFRLLKLSTPQNGTIKEFRAGGHGFDLAPSNIGPFIAMSCRYMESGSMEMLLSFKKRLACFVQHESGISCRVVSLDDPFCGYEWVGGSWIGLIRGDLDWVP